MRSKKNSKDKLPTWRTHALWKDVSDDDEPELKKPKKENITNFFLPSTKKKHLEVKKKEEVAVESKTDSNKQKHVAAKRYQENKRAEVDEGITRQSISESGSLTRAEVEVQLKEEVKAEV